MQENIFLINKYYKWYNNICISAKLKNRIKCDGIYYEKHHIIPKSLGGDNSKENLVLLTAKEHFMCHLLLPKCLLGKNKHNMINALIKMAFATSKNQFRYVSKSYAVIKKMIAEKNSEMFKGRKHSEETKRKIGESNSRALKGKKKPLRNQNYRDNIRNAQNRNDVRMKKSIAIKGRRWINNNFIEIMSFELKEGFNYGRLQK